MKILEENREYKKEPNGSPRTQNTKTELKNSAIMFGSILDTIEEKGSRMENRSE